MAPEKTTPRKPPKRLRKKLRERSDVTLRIILSSPDRAFSVADMASAEILGSFTTMNSWLDRGWFPSPIELPNGRKVWLGSEIAAALRRRSDRYKRKQSTA